LKLHPERNACGVSGAREHLGNKTRTGEKGVPSHVLQENYKFKKRKNKKRKKTKQTRKGGKKKKKKEKKRKKKNLKGRGRGRPTEPPLNKGYGVGHPVVRGGGSYPN